MFGGLCGLRRLFVSTAMLHEIQLFWQTNHPKRWSVSFEAHMLRFTAAVFAHLTQTINFRRIFVMNQAHTSQCDGHTLNKPGWETKGMKQILPFPQVIPNDSFVQAFSFIEELSDVFGRLLQEVVLQQKLDPLREIWFKKAFQDQPDGCQEKYVENFSMSGKMPQCWSLIL